MSSFISNLQQKFRYGGICIQFIYINVAVFLIVTFATVCLQLFNLHATWIQFLELPAWLERLAFQPWSLITYIFMHAGFLHILFNMLWLYWFAQLFLYPFSTRVFRGLYTMGGICGGLLYLFVY